MLRGHDGDSNENVKKAIRFRLELQTCKYITLFGTFPRRSLSLRPEISTHDDGFPFLLLYLYRNSAPAGNFPYNRDKVSELG